MRVKTFGISKDIIGESTLTLNVDKPMTVSDLKEFLNKQYPKMSTIGTYSIAVNQEYADNHQNLYLDDEIAIIPPVSGG
ncbi:MoaD/ThiS family protein [Aquimarina sp. U1-2]|nr:MoaD/ThiS family protein [Aquimarina sp. U1-2]MBP2831074.1 MoaD/ThiS family protein [Aquimarina sp. U1-2]